MPILNEEREKGVIKKNVSNLKNPNYSHIAEKFFGKIMELSRSLQSDIVKPRYSNNENKIIGYQRVEGAF